MDVANIDRMLESLDSPKIAKFGSNPLSCTSIPGLGSLFICLRAKTLMFYTSIERLGAESKNFPALFEMILTSDVSGGRFNNLRLAYDSDTTVLWLCYDINLDDVTTMVLRDTVNSFINNAKSFKKLLKTQLLDVVIQTLRAGVEQNDDSFILSPEIEQACALSLACSNVGAERNYEQNKPVQTSPEVQAQLKQSITALSGGAAGAPSAGAPDSNEPELVNVMIAQSTFMLA